MRIRRFCLLSSSALGLCVGLVASCAPEMPPECPLGTLGCFCDDGECEGDLVCDVTCGPAEAKESVASDGDSAETSSGSDSDGDGDGDNESESDSNGNDGSCESPMVVVSGAMETDVSPVPFDDINDTETFVFHKRDVDPQEDGCISNIEARFFLGGCKLDVEARGIMVPDAQLVVTSMNFLADSQCPDFLDAAEGEYEGQIGGSPFFGGEGDIVGSTIELSQTHIDDPNALVSCFYGTLTLRPQGELYDDDGGKVLSIGGAVVAEGHFNTETLMPELPCPTQCGDGLVEAPEDCEAGQPITQTCADLDLYEAGQLSCSEQCTYDTSQCFSGQPPSGLYSACLFDDDCDPGMTCQVGFCTIPCNDDAQCEADVFGAPGCDDEGGFCALACTFNNQCPEDMICGPDAYCTIP